MTVLSPSQKKEIFLDTIEGLSQNSQVEKNIQILEEITNHAKEIHKLVGVLGGMERERVEGAVRDDLYETLSSEHSMGRAEVDKLIGVLLRDGIIFSPRPGYYERTV